MGRAMEARGEVIDRIVAVVGHHIILASELENQVVEYATAQRLNISDAQVRDTLMAELLDQMVNDRLMLADEALTPDSSRYWDAKTYEPGRSQDSFDKQIVRDWLETTDWNKTPPPPDLPVEVIEKAAGRYRDIAARLME